jgi:hypothetical protein
MDTKFQTSFIPKRPVLASEQSSAVGSRPINLISVIATFIFVVSLLAVGGEYAYKQYLTKKIASMDQELRDARATVQDDLINQFIRLDNRIQSAESLLQGHIATSLLFSALQNETVKNVQFSDLLYQTDSDGTVTVFMRGVSTSYNALALQANIYHQNKYIRNPLFSDLNLDEKGNVNFTFKATILPGLIAQKNAPQALTFGNR